MRQLVIKGAAVLLAASVCGVLAQPSAEAQPVDDAKAQCVAAYQASQELKLDGKLTAARKKAAFCSQEQCPNAVRDGCTKWLAEFIDIQPSLAVTAKGQAGVDLSDVRVLIDGNVAAESLTGRPIEIDPGKHILRFEHAKLPPIEKEILISEGVKNRPVAIDFAPHVDGPTPTGNKPPPPPPPPPPSLVGPIVVGAAGVVALGVFGVLAGTGSSELSNLRSSCGATHSCTQSQIDSTKTKLQIGDVFLGVGVVGVGAAVVWYLARRPGDPPASAMANAVRVSVRPGQGASTSFTLAF
jgi:hypothetical protein